MRPYREKVVVDFHKGDFMSWVELIVILLTNYFWTKLNFFLQISCSVLQFGKG